MIYVSLKVYLYVRLNIFKETVNIIDLGIVNLVIFQIKIFFAIAELDFISFRTRFGNMNLNFVIYWTEP